MKKVKKFPSQFRDTKKKYDWGKILDGNIWLLKAGEDFHISPHNFRATVGVVATRRGKKTHVHVRGDEVYVQAYSANGKKK